MFHYSAFYKRSFFVSQSKAMSVFLVAVFYHNNHLILCNFEEVVNIDNLQCYFDYIIDLLKMKFC